MKIQFLGLMEDLSHQREYLVIILVKQTQNFVFG